MRKIIKQHKRELFLICLFLLGLFMILPYGAHLDQKAEQEILYSNIKMYLRYFGPESSLYTRLDAYGVVEIADTIEKDHGMAVYYPAFWIIYVNQLSPFIGNIVWHIYIYCWVFCGVSALYGLCLNIRGSFKAAALIAALFFFTPRMFAESHYNNKDMILLSLCLCIFYWGFKLWQKPAWKYVLAFSLSGSLAANMKVIGIFVWAVMGFYIFCAMLFSRRFNRKILAKMLVCIALTVFLYILLTPASWTGIGEFFRYLIENAKDFRWNDYILFAGNMYNKNTTGMPRRYLPVMILLTVPTGILFLSLMGLVGIFYSLVRKPSCFFGPIGYACAAILAGMAPLCYAVIAATLVYNGWRHFYFCYASILIMMAYGIFFLLDLLGKYKKEKWAKRTLGAYVLLLAMGVFVNHPYQYAYYNFFAGRQIETVYELDYWDMSFKQAYEIILRDSMKSSISIGTITNPSRWGLDAQLYAIRGKYRMRIHLCDNWREAEYLIINPMYTYMYGQEDYEWIQQNYRLLDTISSYGNSICEIYRK